MKRLIIIVIIIIPIILGYFLLFSKESDKDNSDNNETYKPKYVVADDTNYVKPYEAYSYREKEDGWIEYLDIGINSTTNKCEFVQFNGFNFRYRDIPDIKFYNYDEKTGERLNEFYSEIYYYLIMDNDYCLDSEKINEYLMDMKLDRKITLDDIAEVELKVLDKEQIVKMYNEAYDKAYAIVKDNEKEGKYLNIPFACLYDEEIHTDDFTLRLGYINNSIGKIGLVNIEYIYSGMLEEYKGNAFLSNRITNQTATNEETELYEYIQKIEKCMIDNSDFCFWNYMTDDYNTTLYNRLKTFIESTIIKSMD